MSDRTPPQDVAAEQALLGALLIGGPDAALDTEDLVAGRDFYRPSHELIYDAVLAIARRGERPDMILTAGQLGDELHRVGGAPYLHTLASETPIAANAPHYAAIVAGKALARRLADAGTRVVQLAHEAADPTQVAEDAQQLMAEASSTARTTEGGTTVGAGLDAAIDWLETPPVGADTPWPDVNDRTNGLLAGQMITVAARPGHGKSLVAKDVGLFTAMQGKPVHIATLEMSRNEYMARILAGLATVDLGRMLRRQMNDDEWGRVGRAAERVRELPLYLDDRESQTMAQIRAGARATQRRFGQPLGMVAIDYAQLIRPRDMRLPREQQVAEISRATKLMAKEFQCPVLLLAQLSRKNTDRPDKTPLPSDLRESGSLEQDSDQVWLLHRPDQYGDEGRLGEVDLIVGKNRNGPAPITVALAFQGHYARVASMV